MFSRFDTVWLVTDGQTLQEFMDPIINKHNVKD